MSVVPLRDVAPEQPEVLWARYVRWLGVNVPEVASRLRPPAAEMEVVALEELAGARLPGSLIAGWRLHDGQDELPSDHGAAAGFRWLPVGGVIQQWLSWREVRADASTEDMAELRRFATSDPPGAIACDYTHPAWIPVFQWPLEGNYVGIDLAPGPAGQPGQVINFGRDYDDKFVIATSFDALLGWLVGEAEAGRMRVERVEDEASLLFEHVGGNLVNALAEAVRR